MENSPFGAVIRQRRHDLNISLKEASKRTGLSASRLHDLEVGRSSTTGKSTTPTRANIRGLARGYKLDEDYLLDLAGRTNLDATSDDERRLVSHFRALSRGHKLAVMALVDNLFQIDQQSSETTSPTSSPGTLL
jgi:transcriptional regulator with XRE-family HTH domain